MNKIKIMDELLANKIAAGEVIERCASVVKELIENSIDALSTEIRVDLKESGLKQIRVTDNGIGMSKVDALNSFSRHATSKLLSEEDLFEINTLGFRGEALPSIASVSKIILKTSNKKEGSLIEINGGKVIRQEDCSLRSGTTIEVNELFYNTPARLKHLKSLTTELSHIVNYLEKISLTRPDIKFILTNDEKELLNTEGKGNLLKVIHHIYGLDVTKKMFAIKGENDAYQIEGYISYPEVTRANQNHLIVIVNNRIVKNRDVQRAINDAYHTYKSESRYPIVVLKINVDVSLVDVNVHPTKLDVKFSKLNSLTDLVFDVIRQRLTDESLIVEVKEVSVEGNYELETLNIERVVNEPSSLYLEELDLKIDHKTLKELYPVGLIHGTYLVCENEEGMYLIDQHAAAERINYEKYLFELGNPNYQRTDLLIPYNFELPKNEFILLKEKLDILKALGFVIEESGISSFVIKTHPLWLEKGYEIEAIKRIVEIVLYLEKDFEIEKFNEKIAISLACKKSIKANQYLSHEEMEVLINDLRKTTNPWTCPHGRPTIVFYSSYELEKLFRRSV